MNDTATLLPLGLSYFKLKVKENIGPTSFHAWLFANADIADITINVNQIVKFINKTKTTPKN